MTPGGSLEPPGVLDRHLARLVAQPVDAHANRASGQQRLGTIRDAGLGLALPTVARFPLPVQTVSGADLEYWLVCVDGAGAERTDDPDGIDGRLIPRVDEELATGAVHRRLPDEPRLDG